MIVTSKWGAGLLAAGCVAIAACTDRLDGGATEAHAVETHAAETHATEARATEGTPAASAALLHEGRSIAVPEGSPLRQALQIAVATETTVQRPINAPGVIDADPARWVRIMPPVSGRIERLHKGLGDAVHVGDALVTLDSQDLAQAVSDDAKAQAGLTLTERALHRQQELSQAEISARKDLEQAQSDQAQARSEADRARSRLAQLGVSPGHAGGRSYTLKAPINGHVIELNSGQGGFWNDTNAPLMTVADLSKVWLTASVAEKDVASVFVGQPARILLNAYPGDVFAGAVAYVGPTLDADTRTVKVRVALDNANGRLRPGMYAGATFSAAAHEAITVPAAALIQDGFATRVYVERAPWTFESRPVRTGAQVGSQVEIASGLKAGERVVVKDGVLLSD